MWKIRLSDLLAQQQFVHFWLARLIVTTVNQLLMMAVAWQMYDMAMSAWALGCSSLWIRHNPKAGISGFTVGQVAGLVRIGLKRRIAVA